MARPARRIPTPRAMIVAPQPEAVEAGAAVLAAGGNAMDAALACAFTQGVVDPMMCGIGGLGVMTVHDPKTGEQIVFDGLSPCPAGAHAAMWSNLFERECSDGYGFVLRGAVNEMGRTAVTVPSILRTFADAHAAFGRMPWSGLFDGAIDCARGGWMVRPHVHTMMAMDETAYGRVNTAKKLALTEEGARLYLRADGTPKWPGERIVNAELAATLGIIAREGVDAFYKGEIARRIAADMAAHGGLITEADLAAVRSRRVAPLRVPYRGRTLLLPPPPAGGVFIGEMLRILEHFDLPAMGHNSAAMIAVLAEAMKIAGIDKDTHVGDPDFVPVPLYLLLGDANTAEAAARIRRGERADLARVGAEPKGTTTISCVDAEGLVVSVTHTLGVPSGVLVPGLGFMLNGAMNWYDPRPGRPTSYAPGKRRYSSMSPLIVMEGATPVATLGAPGGAWIGVALAQVLVNLLDFGMEIQEAVLAPRVSATSATLDLSLRIPRATEAALVADGYSVKRVPTTYAFAGVHGIAMWDGALEGAADPQRDGYPAGIA
ncbi:gamma-glutamyltransferase family protein [Neoroseomonas lacus]|uniref:Gamma-glutamyltranspeptidase n=1 Tax=Neoroseomonas lacus TaxID=287609 RepID=A0A917NRN1_9PROT|nr:gamma-glutamyltransferase [Neoroseomonas lacus]GGJ21517.1 gamma-glutamyltranspeptidase [Neoroseomonas lacus]